MRCVKCNEPSGGKFARYCNPCRSLVRRRLLTYVPTDFIDAQIRRVYEARTSRTMPELQVLARRIKWPDYAVRKRASQLGLSGTREPAWTEKETQIVERLAWMCNRKIVERLRAAGFHRTETGVALKRKRLRAGANLPYFTARGLGECLGEDSHKVARWIERGWLPAKKSERKEAWLIHENDVYRFLLEYPMEYELRKVDQLWFLDAITQGKIAA